MMTTGVPVTGTDVAKAAGVSQSAVSLVLSGKYANRVSEVTAARIRQTAKALGYSPNRAASALKTGRVNTICLAVPLISQPFFAAVLQAAEERAEQLGYQIVLIADDHSETWPGRLLDVIRGNQFAGAIVYAALEGEVETLARSGLKIVVCEEYVGVLPSVDLDLEVGMRLAAEHLVARGHTKIAYFGSEHPHQTYRIRKQAFFDAVEKLGAEISAAQRSPVADFDAAVANATTLLGSNSATAVMCDDDLLAPAVIRAADALGKKVPSELSIIGTGDLEIAKMLTPSLTTVAIPARTVGEKAVDQLVALIEGETPEDQIVSTSLRLRDSVAQAPAL